MTEKIEDYPLSGVILKLRTEIEVLKTCRPYGGYDERIKFKQVILKYLMELQRYRVSMRKTEEMSDIRSDS